MIFLKVEENLAKRNAWPWDRLLSRQWSRLEKAVGIALIAAGGTLWVARHRPRQHHHQPVAVGAGAAALQHRPPPPPEMPPASCEAPAAAEAGVAAEAEVAAEVAAAAKAAEAEEVAKAAAAEEAAAAAEASEDEEAGPPQRLRTAGSFARESKECLEELETYTTLVELITQQVEATEAGDSPGFLEPGAPSIGDNLLAALFIAPKSLSQRVGSVKLSHYRVALLKLMKQMPEFLRARMRQAQRQEGETPADYRHRLETMEPSLRKLIEGIATMLKQIWERECRPKGKTPEDLLDRLLHLITIFGEQPFGFDVSHPFPTTQTTAGFLLENYEELFGGKTE